jgi:hypothetical protein
VILVRGTKAQAQALKEQTAAFMREQMRLTLSPEKTHITYVDDGFDFLGFRIKRRPRGRIPVAYSFPSERSFRDIKHRIKELTGRSNIGLSLDELVHSLNPILRGWTNYHRHAAAKRCFSYLDHYLWWRVMLWLRKKHPRLETDQPTVLGAPLDQPGRHEDLLARPGNGDPLPLQGPPHPHAVDDSRRTPGHHPGGNEPFRTCTMIDQRSTLWSAGCVGTRTSGAEGGGEQTTARKHGTAARLRPYIEIVRHTQRDVKRWHEGDMRKRWTAAGMLVAERQFRRIIGYRDLAKLIIAIERHAARIARIDQDARIAWQQQ